MHNNDTVDHVNNIDSLYNIFRTALCRKKFGQSAKNIANMIKAKEGEFSETYDWSEFISFCCLEETKIFWGLVADELDVKKSHQD